MFVRVAMTTKPELRSTSYAASTRVPIRDLRPQLRVRSRNTCLMCPGLVIRTLAWLLVIIFMASQLEDFPVCSTFRKQSRRCRPSLFTYYNTFTPVSQDFRLQRPKRSKPHRQESTRSPIFEIYEDASALSHNSELRSVPECKYEINTLRNTTTATTESLLDQLELIRQSLNVDNSPATPSKGDSDLAYTLALPPVRDHLWLSSCRMKKSTSKGHTIFQDNQQQGGDFAPRSSITRNDLSVAESWHNEFAFQPPSNQFRESSDRSLQSLPLQKSGKEYQNLIGPTEERTQAGGKENIPPGMDDLSKILQSLVLIDYMPEMSDRWLSLPERDTCWSWLTLKFSSTQSILIR